MKKIFINGYGSIGKRIAAFVRDDPEIKIVGVGKHSPKNMSGAISDGFDVYVLKRNMPRFEGMGVAGTIESALDTCDLVVDASPGGMGYDNKINLYEPRGIKAIYQGGESVHGDSAVSDMLFNSRVNYGMSANMRLVIITTMEKPTPRTNITLLPSIHQPLPCRLFLHLPPGHGAASHQSIKTQ